VRAVQDDRMFKANRLSVRDDGAAVHGAGDVRVRMFRSGEGAGRVPVLVDADRMDYRKDDEVLRFTGEVQYQEDTFSLSAPELQARLAPGGGFTSSSATGGVQLRAQGRDEEGRSVEYQGAAARMDYDGGSGEAVLIGGEEPARLANAASGEEFQGPTLRIFLGQDRIVAGGPDHMGRTTIKTVLPGDEP
jgi:lipopolysaccharide transport protein LptA